MKTHSGTVKKLNFAKKKQKGEVKVEFEYQEPSEAYYHALKGFLATYLDGEDQEKLDI